jgi:hypothetical protein
VRVQHWRVVWVSLSASEIRAQLRAKKAPPPPEQIREAGLDNGLEKPVRKETPLLDRAQRSTSKPKKSVFEVKNIEADQVEVAVLSALYTQPEKSFEIFAQEHGRREFLANPICRAFFDELTSYYKAHHGIDPTAFVQNLHDTGKEQNLGGSAFLGQVISFVVPPSALPLHLGILRDKYIAREMVRSAAVLAGRVSAGGAEDMWAAIEEHEQKIIKLRSFADTTEGAENFGFDDLTNFNSRSDPNCLIGHRWVSRGTTTIWAAASGAGKSTLEMQLALYWAIGAPCFGLKPVRPLKSLIVQAENDLGDTAEQFQGVLAGIKATGDVNLNGEVEKMVSINRVIGVAGTEFLRVLTALIKTHRPDIVWIDPFHAFAGVNLLDAKEVGSFLREGLIPIAIEYGVGVQVIHHAGKSSQDSKAKSHWAEIDFQYLGFGSSEIQNAFRAVNVLVPISGHEGNWRLIFSKRGERAGAKDTEGHPAKSIYLSHSKTGCCWLQVDKPEDPVKSNASAATQFQAKFNEDSVLEEMSAIDELTTTQLSKHVMGETGMSRITFFRLFKELKKNGRIRIRDKGWVKTPRAELP